MTDLAPAETARPEAIKAVPVRHPLRWVSAAILLLLVAMLAHSMVKNPAYQWRVVKQYFGAKVITDGLLQTLELTVLAMLIGVVGGVLLAVMRLSPNPVVSWLSWVYIWFFRGTPVLVQLLFWYNIHLLLPTISIGIPFGPHWHNWDTNTLIKPFAAALLGLGLNEAAYMAEIVRGGILSVDEGQAEAATALGMGRLLVMRRVVLPQAMRVIVPPTGNETISMLKTTSLVVVISGNELLSQTQSVYDRTYQTIPLLIVASFWYLIVTSVLTAGQYYVERFYARGSVRALPPTPLQRLRRMLIPRHAEVGGAT